jgi:hypothetical protein
VYPPFIRVGRLSKSVYQLEKNSSSQTIKIIGVKNKGKDTKKIKGILGE